MTKTELSDEVLVDIRRDSVAFSFRGAAYRGTPDFSESLLASLAEIRESSSPSQYGQVLHRAIFRDVGGDTWTGWHSVYQAAFAEGKHEATVRLRLNIDDQAHELHRLWWESLEHPSSPFWPLGSTRYTPLSRYVRLPYVRPTVEADALKVLVAVANPRDLHDRWGLVPLEKPNMDVEAIMESLSHWDRIDCRLEERATSDTLSRRLRNEGFHVLHLIAHGGILQGQQGYVLLEGDDGRTDPVPDSHFAQIVQNREDIQLVVLMSCQGGHVAAGGVFTGMAPRLIEFGVPAVVAMQDLVAIDSAMEFTRDMYQDLAEGDHGLIDKSVNQARDLLRGHKLGTWDWCIPALFMQGQGRLFQPKRRAPRRRTGQRGAEVRQAQSAEAPTTDPSAAVGTLLKAHGGEGGSVPPVLPRHAGKEIPSARQEAVAVISALGFRLLEAFKADTLPPTDGPDQEV
jgi:CHAT domain-containing protein